ncbi:hypothetical protein JTB14_038363, partial [Gonioctena quinquepunctata]
KVWPVPSDFIPYDVFTKPYDTITDLPKPAATTGKEEKNEENIEETEEHEEESEVEDVQETNEQE